MSLINVKNLSFAYEGSSHMIFENVSFQMDTDWKLGFIGRNHRSFAGNCSRMHGLGILPGNFPVKSGCGSNVSTLFYLI